MSESAPNLMPNAKNIEFKEKFVERYSKLTDWEAFRTTSLSYPRKCIRINTLKITIEKCKGRLEKQGWKLEQIPWNPQGFWITHETGRRDIGNTLEHSLGYFYVQEAVSMIPPIALDPKPGDKVLDTCAAPGSKTTQMAQMMQNQGIIVANDYKGDRIAALGINIQRSGISNIVISLMKGHFFKTVKDHLQFDKILVDAPCSGTGTIRKSLRTIKMWNPNMIRKLAGQQRQILDAAYHVLRPGGTMVYSTCSCEPEEDEAIVDWILSKYDDLSLEPFEIKGLKHGEAVTEFEGKVYSPEVKHALRIWPQENNTEGFFVAKIRKNSENP